MDIPASLKDVSVDVYDLLEDARERLDEMNYPFYSVGIDIDKVKDQLERIDPFRMSDFWLRNQGPSYWCGILYAHPWDNVISNSKYHAGTEERIWKIILEHHVAIDKGVATFRFNPKSPLNNWLRTWSTDSNVTTNVLTIIRVAIKYLADSGADIWAYEETELAREEEYEL